MIKQIVAPLFKLNGRFKWAIFIAFVLSVAFTIVFLMDVKKGQIEQKLILDTQKEIMRAWKKTAPAVPLDTVKIFRAIDSLSKEEK